MNDLNLVFLHNNCFKLSPGLLHVANRLKYRWGGWRRRGILRRNLFRRSGFCGLTAPGLRLYP